MGITIEVKTDDEQPATLAPVDLPQGFTAGNGTPVAYKDGRCVGCQGLIKKPSGVSGSAGWGTLPEGHRPAVEVQFVSYVYDVAQHTNEAVVLDIGTDGVIYVYQLDTNGDIDQSHEASLDLANVRFLRA